MTQGMAYVWVLFVLAGAIWKLWDGDGQWMRLDGAFRGAVCIVLSVLACTYAGLGWWGLYVGPVAALNLIEGHTDWESWKWQATRAAAFAALAIFPLGITAWPYLVACGAGGLAYPALFWIDAQRRLPRFWIFDGPEAWARLPFGAAVIGGLAALL